MPLRVNLSPLAAICSVSLALVASSALRAEEKVLPTTEARSESKSPRTPLVEDAVVKIFSTIRRPEPSRPWTKAAPVQATGSGMIVEGNRILTNAHIIHYADRIEVQPNQSGDKFLAEVEYVAPNMDLALLKLEDASLFENRPALQRAKKLPGVKDAVMLYGFPTGGSSLSITKGIVSRIEFAPYIYPTSGLRIQIDAAVNPGNSGGPALVDDQVIGLAFSRAGGGTTNIGYIIPCEEIELFLEDVKDGRYDGKPALHDRLQTLENPALRSLLRLPKETRGLIVNGTDQSDPAYPLKKWDVITHIGPHLVDNEGMIKLHDNLRVRFHYWVQHLAKDGKVSLTLVRDGSEITVDLPVPKQRPMLIPQREGEYPPYFIVGPVVFSHATNHFASFFSANASAALAMAYTGSPLVKRRGDQPAFPGEELVIVSSPLFPHKLSKGYGNPALLVVTTINDVPIQNLAHLVRVIRDLQDEFVTISFAGTIGETLVFPRKELLASTEDVLTDAGIRSQGSPDLMKIWNQAP